MQNPHAYKGTTQPVFRHLRATFAESYARIIFEKAEAPFLVFYGPQNQRATRTFSSFDNDVQRARAFIGEPSQDASVFVLIDSNSPENMIFAVAAILNGFSLCPMNPDDGAERLAKKIAQLDESCTVWIGLEISEEIGEATGAKRMRLPEGNFAACPMPRKFEKDRAMVLIFTSGTTGASRIVEQSELSILSNVDALISRHKLESGEHCIATPLPLFHVNALEFSFFGALLAGQRLVIFKSFQLGQILDTIASERVSILSVIPQMINILCSRRAQVLKSDTSSLRYVKTAAAPLSKATARQFIEAFPFQLIQGYGLSEAVNFSAVMPIDLSRDEYARWMTKFDRPSIGTEIEGNEIAIFIGEDEVGKPGVTGEVCVRGFNVMNGYRGDVENKCFAGGYLHTGDLGFFEVADDGRKFFFINGRIKDVIKRYGQTISLVEIDDALGSWVTSGIDAIAVPFDNELAGEEVGVVVSGDGIDSKALLSLKSFLEASLPPTLRPACLVAIDEPLRTASGKPTRWKFIERFAKARSLSFTPSIAILSL